MFHRRGVFWETGSNNRCLWSDLIVDFCLPISSSWTCPYIQEKFQGMPMWNKVVTCKIHNNKKHRIEGDMVRNKVLILEFLIILFFPK